MIFYPFQQSGMILASDYPDWPDCRHPTSISERFIHLHGRATLPTLPPGNVIPSRRDGLLIIPVVGSFAGIADADCTSVLENDIYIDLRVLDLIAFLVVFSEGILVDSDC